MPAMKDLEARLLQYRLGPSPVSPSTRGFELAINDCRFDRTAAVEGALSKYKKVPGLYLWLVSLHGCRYKVYIGHTTDLAYRLSNYISEFQPHAPNDFKLRIFHSFIRDQFPNACFEFYVKPLEDSPSRADLHAAENAEIAAWAPVLLNRKGKASAEAKATLERAFSGFYRSAFESLLVE